MLSDGGFFLDNEHRQPYNEFTCYTLQADKGQGHFWVYFYEIRYFIWLCHILVLLYFQKFIRKRRTIGGPLHRLIDAFGYKKTPVQT